MNHGSLARTSLSALIAFALAGPLSAQTLSPAEQAVWDMEERYWRYLESANLDGYMTLWHNAFVGWPTAAARPAQKGDIRSSIQSDLDDGWRLDAYRLRPEAVRIIGDIAIVHYAVQSTWVNHTSDSPGDSPFSQLDATAWYKITHTWKQTEMGWQIISGMAAPLGEQ